MRQFRVPLPMGFMQWQDEAAARKYLAGIMDQTSYYWQASRVKFNGETLQDELEQQRFKTLREALTWATTPFALEASGVDMFHATCFLCELDYLACTDELIDEPVEMPAVWEKLDWRYSIVL